MALAANMEGSRASAVVQIALPAHPGQVDVDNILGFGAGDLLIPSSLAGVAVTASKGRHLTEQI